MISDSPTADPLAPSHSASLPPSMTDTFSPSPENRPFPLPDASPLPLPSVHELLSTPIRPSDIFTSIPGPCLHSTVLLLIRLVRAATAANTPDATHQAFMRLHMLPTVVLRKAFRGEPGWRSSRGQMHALRLRLRRASTGREWGTLWREALHAHEARRAWQHTHSKLPSPHSSRAAQAARAMRLASQAQYGRAMRTFTNPPLANLNDTATVAALQALHPDPPVPVMPLPPSAQPRPPEVSEQSVLRAVRRLNPNSAAGPDRMSPKLLHLLAHTQISPEAGVTGISALTNLVSRLARGSLPPCTIPLVSAATLLPLQPRPAKIRPIAIGQSIRRLVTKVLLPAAIEDCRDHFAPEQLANGVPNGMDAIVHDARMLLRRHGRDPHYVMVSIDASNAFNRFSRQKVLDQLPTRAPSLSRFLDMVYARTTSPLILPSSPPTMLVSREGSQQGDPASMLLFSLALQPLARRISHECDVLMNRWYADDGTIIGRIDEVAKALKILNTEGPTHQFFLNPAKTRVFWPSLSPDLLLPLTTVAPLHVIEDGGLELLGAPIGSDSFMTQYITRKLQNCNSALAHLDHIPEARVRFHLHRVSASACRMQHLFRLVPPTFAFSFAQQFDRDQLKAYERFNSVTLSPSLAAQVRLPFVHGGHGLTSLANTSHASYAASLIDSAPVRLKGPQFPNLRQYQRFARTSLRVVLGNLPPSVQPPHFSLTSSDLGCLEPTALLARPERIHTFLLQAQHSAAASRFWEKPLWQSSPDPRQHSAASIRRRVRFRSLLAPGATSFLTAHPAATSRIHNATWSTMLRRHLDAPITFDSISPLRCAHCSKPLDPRGDHATICSHGFGLVHRHNTVRNVFARHVFRGAGLAYSLEVPFLLPNSAARPADILVQPSPPAPGLPCDKPTAYDVTICSPFRRGMMYPAARQSAGAAEAADVRKRQALERTIRSTLLIDDHLPPPPLDWHFQPLSFDTLGAPSQSTLHVIHEHAKLIALRSSCTIASAQARIHQRLSFAIWSTVAAAILSRLPTHVADISYPIEV